MRLIFAIFGFSRAETPASEGIELSREFSWSWDIENNCGPRPQGPMYPAPSPDSSGTHQDPGECDIVQDALYVHNYKCRAKCQEEPEKEVTLFCNCFIQIGPVRKVKQCEWDYTFDESCPPVKAFNQFDWECDPRRESNNNCEAGQYPELEAAELENNNGIPTGVGAFGGNNVGLGPGFGGFNPLANFFNRARSDGSGDEAFVFDEKFQLGDGTQHPLLALGENSRPIIIAPQMTQEVGDITAGGHHSQWWDAKNGLESNETEPSGNFRSGYEHDGQVIRDQEIQIRILEEKVKSLKTLVKFSSDTHEKDRSDLLMAVHHSDDLTEKAQQRFDTEKQELKDYYEKQLKAKEFDRQELQDRLFQLEDFLAVQNLEVPPSRARPAMFNDVEIVATTEEAEIPEIEIPEVLEYEDEEIGDKIEGSGARRARFQALNKEMKQKEKQRRRKKARRQQARAEAKSDENL